MQKPVFVRLWGCMCVHIMGDLHVWGGTIDAVYSGDTYAIIKVVRLNHRFKFLLHFTKLPNFHSNGVCKLYIIVKRCVCVSAACYSCSCCRESYFIFSFIIRVVTGLLGAGEKQKQCSDIQTCGQFSFFLHLTFGEIFHYYWNQNIGKIQREESLFDEADNKSQTYEMSHLFLYDLRDHKGWKNLRSPLR